MSLKHKIIFYILAIVYVVDVPFFFLPFSIRSRFFLGLIGILLFLYQLRKKPYFNKKIVYNILFLLLLLFPFALTSTININLDAWGFRAILNVLVFFASYLVIRYKVTHEEKNNLSFDEIAKIILNVIVINIIIALIMFFFDPLKNAVFLLQGQAVDVGSRNYYASLFRVYGIGNFFFYQGGVFCSWGLIIATYFLKKSRGYDKIICLQIYLFIFFSGIFIARTVFIGFIFSIIYLFFPNGVTKKLLNRSVLYSLLSLILIAFTGLMFYDNFRDWLLNNQTNRSVAHAFELFINLFESGRFESDSTSHLATMFVLPDSLKTWLFGDGIFQDGNHYYMHTDVGYLRLIFFFGLLGLVIFYVQKLYLLYSTAKLGKMQYKEKLLFFFLFLFTLATNFKGFADLDPLVFLFFWAFIFQNKQLSNTNENYT